MAITGFVTLFAKTKAHVQQTRNTQTIDPIENDRLHNRSIQLLFLDALLAKHRLEYGNTLNRLKGRSALYHKLLMKYKWPIRDIVEMTLLESLLALQDEMKPENLPEDAQRFFSNIQYTHFQATFPDLLEEEWEPNLADELLCTSEK